MVCKAVWGFPRPLWNRSNANDSTQDVKHHVCQLIDTVSQRLAFLQSAALLFPQGPQMLALLLAPSPSFHPDNICTAVLSTETMQPALELLTARGRSAQMAGGGVRGLAKGRGGGGVAGRVWGSHLALMLAICPGASPMFPWQKNCQELEVTLRKMLYSLGGFSGVGVQEGLQMLQSVLILVGSKRKDRGTM